MNKEEYHRYSELLNIVVGLFSFALAIACLSSSYPKLASSASFLFVTFLIIHVSQFLPSRFRKLRDKKRTLKEENEFQTLRYESFSFRGGIRSFPIFLVGYISLFLLTAYNFF